MERCLSYDEKPLLLFQNFKEAKKNPAFMIRHIKDVRSPIVIAQQKHAVRKASSIPLTNMTMSDNEREGLKPSDSEVTPNTAPEMPPILCD
jgi:bZIP factor